MEKELEELLKKLKELKDEMKEENSKIKKENIKEANEKIINALKNQEHECLIFATDNCFSVYGSLVNIQALVASIIRQLSEDGDKEAIMEACLIGLASKEDKCELDKDKVDEILEMLKDLM